MARLRVHLSFLVFVFFMGCGGGTEGTGGSTGSGAARELLGSIRPETPISDLTMDDSTSLCERLRTKAQQLGGPETQCRYGAVTTLVDFLERYLNGESLASDTAGVRSQCERATSACIEIEPPASQVCAADASTRTCILDDQHLKVCGVRAEVVASCVLELFGELESFYDGLVCDELEARPFGVQSNDDAAPPAAERPNCAEVADQCSGIGIGFSECNVRVVR